MEGLLRVALVLGALAYTSSLNYDANKGFQDGGICTGYVKCPMNYILIPFPDGSNADLGNILPTNTTSAQPGPVFPYNVANNYTFLCILINSDCPTNQAKVTWEVNDIPDGTISRGVVAKPYTSPTATDEDQRIVFITGQQSRQLTLLGVPLTPTPINTCLDIKKYMSGKGLTLNGGNYYVTAKRPASPSCCNCNGTKTTIKLIDVNVHL